MVVVTAAPRTSALSIRARLALWYAGSVLLVFVLFAAAMRQHVRTVVQDEFSASVRSSAEAIRSFFRLEYLEYRDVDATIAHIANEVVFPDRVVEFVAPDGVARFRIAPGRRTGNAAGVSTGPKSAALLPPLRSLSGALNAESAPGWTVRVSASAAPLTHSLAQIDAWLMIGIPLGVLVACAAGWWLAGRTLRPVAAMAEAAARMATMRRGRGAPVPQHADHGDRLPIDNPEDELGRLGTRFNALLDEVDGALAQQRRFLADAAHELRTPVARMIGTVDLALLDTATLAAPAVAALDGVRRDLGRTARLVDELLQLARADAAGTVRLTSGYLDDVVVDAVHAWQGVAARHGVQLDVQTLEESPARFDPVYVERLVGILLDNAVRYTPRGGVVRVDVQSANGTAVLSVADTGIGIPAEEQQRVFERFFRGTAARAMSRDGSGLGLAIARWIADAHRATLELASGAGGGTVARVTFPSP